MADRRADICLTDIRNEIAGIRALTRAVQHALLIIAEAAKHIPAELKARRPDVPWQKIHGLGNLLRHEYRGIDPVIQWSVITDHLDELDAAAEALLDNRPSR